MSAPTPESTALEAAERLVDRLRDGSTSGALTAIGDLRTALSGLEQELRATRHQEMEAAVATAAGNARTHDWVITSRISCGTCGLTTTDHVVRSGALPECGPGGCTGPSTYHLVLLGDDDGTTRRCAYCKTVYPATADTREGVTA